MLTRQFDEVVSPQHTQNDLRGQGKGGSAGFGVQRFNLIEDVGLAVPDQGTATRCLHIPVPIDIRAIGQLEHEVIIQVSCDDGRLVQPAAASPDMLNNGKWSVRRARQSSRQRIQGVFEENSYRGVEYLL